MNQVLVIDYDKKLAYTPEGKALKISEPVEDRWTHKKPVGRVVQFYTRETNSLQVDWDGMLVYADKVNEGLFECPFPIRDSDKSIHYQAQAPMGWNEILSCSPDHLPKEISIRENNDGCSVEYSATVPLSAGQPRSSYRLIVEPTPQTNYFSYSTPESPNIDLYEYFKGKRKDIRRIRLLKQDYDVVKEGYLACGSIPSKDNTTPENDKIEIIKIANVSPDLDILQQWKPDGTRVNSTDDKRIKNGLGSKLKGYRNLAIWIRIGRKYDSDAYFKFIIPQSFAYTSRTPPTRISEDCREYQLCGSFAEDLRVDNLKLGIASGPYQEIIRKKVSPSNVSNSLTIESHRDKKGNLRCENFFVDVPKEYLGQQYSVSYVDTLGRIHDTFGNMEDTRNGRVGFQFQGPVSRRDEIAEVIVKARPFRNFEFKDVHFYSK